MTHKEKIKLIREKCILANPEIVELKFGCVIKWKSKWTHNRMMKGFVVRRYEYPLGQFDVVTDDGLYEDMHTLRVNDKREKPISFEIIGRPIRWADILVMFGDRIHNDDRIGDLEWGMTYSWNLKDDNLENQSETCINFLTELLK